MATILDVGQRITETIPGVDKLKLYKLCFYAQAWHLAWAGSPLFTEQLQAWVHGPVSPDLRRATEPVAEGNRVFRVPGGNAGSRTNYEVAVVDSIVDHYGSVPSLALSKRSHASEAWIEARGDLGAHAIGNEVISITTLRDEFARRIDGDAPRPHAPAFLPDVEDSLLDEAAGDVERDWWETLRILADR